MKVKQNKIFQEDGMHGTTDDETNRSVFENKDEKQQQKKKLLLSTLRDD